MAPRRSRWTRSLSCQTPPRLISLIKSGPIAKKVLTAMHLPTEIPELPPARPPPRQPESGENWVN